MGTATSKVYCDAPPLPPPGAAWEEPLEAPPLQEDAPAAPPSPSSDANANANAPSSMDTNIPNPGPYEAATMPAKRLVCVDTHPGFKCDISKQLSPFMVAIHSFHLGAPNESNKSYNFITQVADEEGLLMTNVDPANKSINGRIHKGLLGGLAMGKLQVAVTPDGSGDQLLGEVDFGGMTWTGNLKYGSMGGGQIFGMNYYQNITKKLAMGGEGMFIAANGNMMSSYLVKYECDAPRGDVELSNKGENPSSWLCAQIHPAQGMLNFNYKRVVTPNRVSLGAELQMNPALESQVVFGAEFKLSRSRVSMAVDGTGKIQTNLETALGMPQGSPKLNFNGEVDFGKDSFVFGYGLNIG